MNKKKIRNIIGYLLAFNPAIISVVAFLYLLFQLMSGEEMLFCGGLALIFGLSIIGIKMID